MRVGGGLRSQLLATSMIVGLLAGASPALAAAADAAPAPSAEEAADAADAAELDAAELSEVVITATRSQPGAVVGDIKPEIQLGPAAIQSYGVSSVTELLEELAPQIRSDAGGGGTSVTLLNGRRISGFNEIRDLPTEAILRVDILPEEAALRFGYPADQRVVNIVLRRRFRALTSEVMAGGPTEGGQASGQLDANTTRVRGDNRLNLSLKLQKSTALTEDERDLTPLPGRRPYDLIGNVTGSVLGAEIDPALSALAGRPTTIAGVPTVAGSRPLLLSDFAATAGTANVSDIGRYRSLIPETQQITANGVFSRVLPHDISATVNATLGASTSDSDQGLPGVSLRVPAGDPFSPFGRGVGVHRYVDALGPLQQSINGWTGHLGGTLNRDFGRWRGSLTAAYDHADTRTRSDSSLDPTAMQGLLDGVSPTFNPFGPLPGGLLSFRAPNTARSRSDAFDLQAQASGPLFSLPAGKANASLKLGDSYSGFASRSARLGTPSFADLSRNDLSARGSLDLPITSKSADVLSGLGDLSFNLTAALDRVSDFGTLSAYGYGLRWTPLTGVRLFVSKSVNEAAPTVQQLGDPVVITEGVRVFDLRTGRTVDVTRISGGNPGLVGERRDVFRINLNIKPFTERDLTFSATYTDRRGRNPIQSLSTSNEIEAAFPERFIRDADGDLVQLDSRPVNFASQQSRQLRWGVNYSRTLGRPPARRPRPEVAAANPAAPAQPNAAPGTPQAAPQAAPGGRPAGAGPRGGGGRGGGRGGAGGGFGGPGGQGPQVGRLQFALYHTVLFEDQLLVRPGGPVLDRLDGSTSGGAGQARHEIEAQAGYSAKGLGARLSADWKSSYFIRGGALSATGDLAFSSLAVANLRLFADFAQMRSVVAQRPWLRGTRVTLSVTNLFNKRIEVRDASGATPLSYQPAYLDPAGRVVRLSVRKVF